MRIRTLTNSQEATDVLPVHAGYIGYREGLLDAGVEVYELKSTQDRTLSEQLGILGASSTSLHYKVFSVDGRRIFIGSFNFDPHSARLNSEMGLLIESTALARAMSAAFGTRMKLAAYRVVRAEDGALIWIEPRADGGEMRHFREPHTIAFGRAHALLKPGGFLACNAHCLEGEKKRLKFFVRIGVPLAIMPNIQVIPRQALLTAIGDAGLVIEDEWQKSAQKPLFVLARKLGWHLHLASAGDSPYIPLNSGASASTPEAPPESFTGRAPVFLCPITWARPLGKGYTREQSDCQDIR